MRTTPSATAAEITRLVDALATAAEEAREPIELAGSKEATALLGLDYDRFYKLQRRGRLPEPVAELACGPIWRVSDLEAWRRIETVTVRDGR